MPRSYRHISDDAEKIIRLKEEGYTGREICERFGFTKKQYTNFITRYNRKQEKIAAGIAIKKKGRPPKDYQFSEKDNVAKLRYIIDRKDAKIKTQINTRSARCADSLKCQESAITIMQSEWRSRIGICRWQSRSRSANRKPSRHTDIGECRYGLNARVFTAIQRRCGG